MAVELHGFSGVCSVSEKKTLQNAKQNNCRNLFYSRSCCRL